MLEASGKKLYSTLPSYDDPPRFVQQVVRGYDRHLEDTSYKYWLVSVQTQADVAKE